MFRSNASPLTFTRFVLAGANCPLSLTSIWQQPHLCLHVYFQTGYFLIFKSWIYCFRLDGVDHKKPQLSAMCLLFPELISPKHPSTSERSNRVSILALFGASDWETWLGSKIWHITAKNTKKWLNHQKHHSFLFWPWPYKMVLTSNNLLNVYWALIHFAL